MTPAGTSGATTPCPEVEALAAYVDRRLPAEETARIEEHLAQCRRCYLVFTRTLRPVSQTQSLPTTRPLRLLAPIAAGLALATMAGLVLRWLPGTFRRGGARVASVESPRAGLVQALGAQRVVEARLTGGFAFGPLRPRRRAAAPEAEAADILAAVADLNRLANSRPSPSPQIIGAQGVAQLILADPDAATRLLEQAVGLAPRDARLASDLAAAYLARAAWMPEAADVPRALEAATRAVEIDPDLLEARFNRALALETLSLAAQAEQAWQEYLKVDRDSEWAREAQRHLDALRARSTGHSLWERRRPEAQAAARRGDERALRSFVAQAPGGAAAYFDEELLPRWASRQLAGQPTQEDRRELALFAGALRAVTGDALQAETAAVIRAAGGGPDRDRSDRLARGHRALAEARSAYLDDDLGAAEPLFEAARSDLLGAGSPYGAWADLYLAIVSYQGRSLDQARATLSAVERLAEARGYASLGLRALRMQGLIDMFESRTTRALERYARALRLARSARDDEQAAAVLSLIAEAFDSLGETGRAWEKRLEALAGMGALRQPRARHGLLWDAVTACLRQDLPRAALPFDDALVALANDWRRPGALAEAYLQRALIWNALGRPTQALDDLGAAETQAGAADAVLGANLGDALALAKGFILGASRPQEALQALDRLAARAADTGESWLRPLLHLARGRAHQRAAEPEQAEADFERGIAYFERLRPAVADAHRIAFFSRASDLFDAMVALQLARGRPERALAFVERARARQLLDTLMAPEAPRAAAARLPVPLGPAAIQARLPQHVAVVFYSSGGGRLLAWVLTRRECRVVTRDVPGASLAALVRAHRSALERRGDEGEVRRAAADLHDALVAPLGLRPDERVVVFVPHEPVQLVAFAALLDRRSGRYLAQDHAVGTAPSGTLFVEGLRPGPPLPAGWSPSALVVGNPRVDRQALGLREPPALPGAEAEAADVAALYAQAELVTGAEATKARFLSSAAHHDVVHFAGHALASSAGEPPRLLLASGPGGSGALSAPELAGARLRGARLVVLAGCRTAEGPPARGEGPLSLGRAFLAAGAAAVVTTLWSVEDDASRPFLVQLHRAFLETGDAYEAVNRTQRLFIGSTDVLLQHPATWAGFQVLGSLSDLQTEEDHERVQAVD